MVSTPALLPHARTRKICCPLAHGAFALRRRSEKKGERNRSEGGINKTPSWYQKKTMLQCRNAAEGKKKKTPI